MPLLGRVPAKDAQGRVFEWTSPFLEQRLIVDRKAARHAMESIDAKAYEGYRDADPMHSK